MREVELPGNFFIVKSEGKKNKTLIKLLHVVNVEGQCHTSQTESYDSSDRFCQCALAMIKKTSMYMPELINVLFPCFHAYACQCHIQKPIGTLNKLSFPR